MKKLLFSILCAFMVSTMASAQYLNVKLDDGTYRSFKTSSKTEVSFGDKKDVVSNSAKDYTNGTMAIEQTYINVKLGEGIWRSFEETPRTEVSFGEKKEQDRTSINGHECVKLAGYYWATENVGVGCDVEALYDANNDVWGSYYKQTNALQAAATWGSEGGYTWALPSKEQWQALNDKCTWTWKDSYPYNNTNVPGMLVEGKEENGEEGNSVFLPAAGYYSVGNNYNTVRYNKERGYYWSSDVEETTSYIRHFTKTTLSIPTFTSTHGMSVRPVAE